MSLTLPAGAAFSGKDWTWIVASYCLGCFTAGYYWTRFRTGQDIRTLGSGNVGARNVGRVLGPWSFAVTLLLDVLKGALAVGGALQFKSPPEAVIASMIAVVIGHNWPLQLRFQGGKGVAVSVGALLAYDPFIVFCVVAIFLPVIALLRNFTLSGMAAFAFAPLAVFLCGLEKEAVAAISFVAILVLIAHRRNIREEVARLVHPGAVKPAPIEMHKGPNDEGQV